MNTLSSFCSQASRHPGPSLRTHCRCHHQHFCSLCAKFSACDLPKSVQNMQTKLTVTNVGGAQWVVVGGLGHKLYAFIDGNWVGIT